MEEIKYVGENALSSLVEAIQQRYTIIPKATNADAGKFLRVNSSGDYALETIQEAEEVGF